MAEKPSLPRKLLAGWMAIAGRFGGIQTLVILSFFYILMIGPVSIVMGVAGKDLLGKRGLGQGKTAWSQADTADPDLERAKLQS